MKYILIILIGFHSSFGFSQDTLQLIILSEKVGAVIDSSEKAHCRLFPYYSSKDFESAELFMLPDSSMILKAVMKDGTFRERVVQEEEYSMMRKLI